MATADQIHAATLAAIAAQMDDGTYKGNPPLEKSIAEGEAMEAWKDIVYGFGETGTYVGMIANAPEAAPMSYSLLTQAMEPPVPEYATKNQEEMRIPLAVSNAKNAVMKAEQGAKSHEAGSGRRTLPGSHTTMEWERECRRCTRNTPSGEHRLDRPMSRMSRKVSTCDRLPLQ
ncbi:Hypothetical predicted protein [Lecanosticta acicola]|uniref:Uncharacterized protein n=1 Tax=Lecanosticta acicola TaxID=111012 RepID=A0AAI8Z5L7_9PEZI|nr:Hypothetical predicted protein [Lecanosticta acicola]